MVFGFGKKKKGYGSDDFILNDKEIRSFGRSKRKTSREDKRKAKLVAMKEKTSRLRERNKVSGELEDARRVRSNIRKKSFARRTAGFRSGVRATGGIIKKVKKKSESYKSSSPFAPENWK